MFERYLIQWPMLRLGRAFCQASGHPDNALQMPLHPFRMALRKSESILEGGQCIPQVTGSDLVVQPLKNEGVDTVFSLTGGTMSDVAGLCLEMQFTSIDVRHEQAAAMMAHAYSRLTGTPGICFAASGPGTT